ncbi:MAG: hypothetical protein HY279_14560 [Nitrospinae bacterium]|nr:hypothetical protein [Nitrospinota bacterium]
MERNGLSPIKLEDAIRDLADAFKGRKVKFIFVGALAVKAYGHDNRVTYDIDAEVVMENKEDYNLMEKFIEDYMIRKGIPAHLTDNVSRWGMIDIPSGYRDRTKLFKKIKDIEFHLLSPVDLVISKLRAFRDKDIEDSKYLVRKFNISIDEIKKAAEKAIETSPRSLELGNFKRNLNFFFDELRLEIENKVQLDEPEIKL